MKSYNYYTRYSLSGIKRHHKKPSLEDVPKEFTDLINHMGFDIEDEEYNREGCLIVGEGMGSEISAWIDFKEGLFVAKADSVFGRIPNLKLEEIPQRNRVFRIPGTYGGGTMAEEKDVRERIPNFRDYLIENYFSIKYSATRCPTIRKKFITKQCAELWGGNIEVFPNEPYGEELIRLCEEYRPKKN